MDGDWQNTLNDELLGDLAMPAQSHEYFPRRAGKDTIPQSRLDDRLFGDGRAEAAMRRRSLEGSTCAVARALDVIGDWWSLLIIRDALAGAKRFGDFQRSLGVARNILSMRLRALVETGILQTAPASDGAAYLEYLVTERGRALTPVLVALAQWSEDYTFERRGRRAIPLDAQKRQPLQKLQMVSEDGRPLACEDVVIVSPNVPKRA